MIATALEGGLLVWRLEKKESTATNATVMVAIVLGIDPQRRSGRGERRDRHTVALAKTTPMLAIGHCRTNEVLERHLLEIIGQTFRDGFLCHAQSPRLLPLARCET